MIQLFNTILYQPIFNLLIYFYNVVPGHDIGLAIIALTIIVKLVLLPFSLQSVKSQKALQELQPKIEELKKKYADSKEKLAQETMKLYNMSIPNAVLAVLSGLAQYVQTKMMTTKKQPVKTGGAKDENMLASMNKSMLYFMPIMTIVIGMSLPAGLTFYWFLTTVFTSVQQLFMFKKDKIAEMEIIPPTIK